MKPASIVTSLLQLSFMLQSAVTHPAQLTALIGNFRRLRIEAFNILNETVSSGENMRLVKQGGKVQRFVRKKLPCPLNNTRSAETPESVHRLRPGDIDVIAGIGDSLTAGVGLMATQFAHVPLEHRGIAVTAGGKGSWRKFLTVPNIIKTFNPNLTGYATEAALTLHNESHLNVAELSAVSEDMPYMAAVLVQRMKEDDRIDIKKHWKMVTMMVGPNDFCSHICFEDNMQQILDKHRKELKQVLTILKQNLPRTLVNLIPPPNLKFLLEMTAKPPMCENFHLLECPCLFGPTSKGRQELYIELMEQWQKIDLEVAEGSEFDDDDFTVVVQPFTLEFYTPNTTAGTTDYSYLSEDCFHLSQKGNARANSLWNNIMEPVGMKSRKPVELFNIKCPSEQHPYIFTRRNSAS